MERERPSTWTALETAFKATSLGGLGVFQKGQDPIIVGQGAYNSAYGTSFQNSGPNAGLVQIFNTTFSFKTLTGGAAGPSLTFPLMPKQIQDEMGEAFDHDYGRMSGFLGVESPNPQAGVQNMILYPYVNPVSELIDMTSLPLGNAVNVTPIASAADGTQIWKVTHNGVDTHPIHFHLYDVQVINRVGWDGIIRKPDLNELGWKDTVRISPLEDTIVALRPVRPVAPFDQPNSVRRLNPAQPLGSQLGFNNQDVFGNPTQPITNDVMNFGWEYVWHCHILSHEEMDMMRPQSAAVPPIAPTGLTATLGAGGVGLSWADNSKNETGFVVRRALAAGGPWTDVATVASQRDELHRCWRYPGPDQLLPGDRDQQSGLFGSGSPARRLLHPAGVERLQRRSDQCAARNAGGPDRPDSSLSGRSAGAAGLDRQRHERDRLRGPALHRRRLHELRAASDPRAVRRHRHRQLHRYDCSDG